MAVDSINRVYKGALSVVANLAPRTKAWLVIGALVAAACIFVLLLILPGKTYATQNTWDLLIFWDGADRVIRGQIPNREFHTPLGPLGYLLPALGLWISGSLGGMMPVATGLFALLLVPVLIYACLSRLPWAYALAFGLYILILALAPAHIGDLAPRPTFGMFYNRFSWALLSLLFLFVLPRRSFGRDWMDALAMAALAVLIFYLKISYAAVAGAFLLALAAFPHARRAAVGAALLAIIALVAVELFWSETENYIRDIRMAGAASGPLRGGLLGIVASVVNNLAACYLFASVMLLAFFSRARLDFLLMCLFMGGAGIMLANQNYQGPGILTFVPAALIAALAPRRGSSASIGRPALAEILLVGALAIALAVGGLGNLAYHFVAASREPGTASSEVRLDGLITQDAPPSSKASALTAPRETRHQCGSVALDRPNLEIDTGPQPLGQSQYLLMVEDAVRLLERDRRLSGKIFVLDMANPFAALLGRDAPIGVDSWNHAARTFSETAHRPPQRMFADTDVVLVPKIAVEYETFDLLRRVYGPHLQANFDLVARTGCWDAYRKKSRVPPLGKPPGKV